MGISHVVSPATRQSAARGGAAAGGTSMTLLESGLVVAPPSALDLRASVADAVAALSSSRAWAVPVTDRGFYIGAVTTASLLGLALPLAPETVPPSGLGWLPIDPKRLQRQLADRLAASVEQAIDIGVPTIRVASSPAHLVLMLARRAPAVMVLDDDGRRLLGIASGETALRLLTRAF